MTSLCKYWKLLEFTQRAGDITRAMCVCQLSGRDARCLFQELQTDDHYTELRSVVEPRWYVGFSKKGRRLRADSWDHTADQSQPRLRHDRRRRHVRHRCRQFVKTQVTLIDDYNHASSSAAAFNHQPVDFQRIYFRLRAQETARRDRQTRRTWHWRR